MEDLQILSRNEMKMIMAGGDEQLNCTNCSGCVGNDSSSWPPCYKWTCGDDGQFQWCYPDPSGCCLA